MTDDELRDELAVISNPATRQRLLDAARRFADAQVAAERERIATDIETIPAELANASLAASFVAATERAVALATDNAVAIVRGEAWGVVTGPEMQDFQDSGEPIRQMLGIDGTAGDAQDEDHPFIPANPGGPCVVCGLAKSYRRHIDDWTKSDEAQP